MSEKIYNTMKHAGGANLVLGIIIMVTGICTGVLMIIHGAKLLKSKNQVLI